MKHLSPVQFVDAAEGCANAAAVEHAAACEACRSKIEAVASAIRAAGSAPPPEPSPLFWPHLAARIGDAVRREPGRVPFWRPWAWRLAPAGAAAVLVVAVGVGIRMWTGAPVGGAPGLETEAVPPASSLPDRAVPGDAPDDPSWLLVSALSAEVSVDDADASGVLPAPGGTEQALWHLDDAERVELARILREEIGSRVPLELRGPGV